MDQDKKDKAELNEQEEKELRDSQYLFEMDRENPGWQIIKRQLEDMAFHSWVDPRESQSEEEWVWKEKIAWAAANVAKEILEGIRKAISDGEYLQKVKAGEIKRKRMLV